MLEFNSEKKNGIHHMSNAKFEQNGQETTREESKNMNNQWL